jgi:hypothetical protein
MVDIAIAANFARELTEDQFAEQKRVQRRNRAASRTASGSDTAAREARVAKKTRIGRTFARLAQVRG